MRLNRSWRALHEDCRGLEGIEYLLIAALVILASICAWRYLGTKTQSDVKEVAAAIDLTTTESTKTDQDAPPPVAPPASPPATPPVTPPIAPPSPTPPLPPTIGQGYSSIGMAVIQGFTHVPMNAFSLTQEQLDAIKANNGYVSFKFTVGNLSSAVGATIKFGSQSLTLANGANEIRVNASNLKVGVNTFLTSTEYTTGNRPPGYRENSQWFNVNNLSAVAGK